MLVWMKWVLVCAIAALPIESYLGVMRLISGTSDRKDDPGGCAVVGLLLLGTAPFIGWWVYHAFDVVPHK